MLDATITADLVLVSTCMEKAQVERFAIIDLGKKYFIDVFFRIIVVVTVAGYAAQYDALVIFPPFIDW